MTRDRGATVPRARSGLSDQLRQAIAEAGPAYAVGQLAGVDPGVVQRFLTGRRDLRLGTADRLASALGLRLARVEIPLGRGRRGQAIPSPRQPRVEGTPGRGARGSRPLPSSAPEIASAQGDTPLPPASGPAGPPPGGEGG